MGKEKGGGKFFLCSDSLYWSVVRESVGTENEDLSYIDW